MGRPGSRRDRLWQIAKGGPARHMETAWKKMKQHRGSTMSAPTVIYMYRIGTLKIARLLETLGDSGFLQFFRVETQVMTWQTPNIGPG